jgi:hypothetical protein
VARKPEELVLIFSLTKSVRKKGPRSSLDREFRIIICSGCPGYSYIHRERKKEREKEREKERVYRLVSWFLLSSAHQEIGIGVFFLI